MALNREIEEEENLGIATAIMRSIPIKPANKLTKEPCNIKEDGDANYYRELLLSEFDNILVDKLSNKLSLLYEINHRISYKPMKLWIAHKYQLPETYKQFIEHDVHTKLRSKIYRYTSEVPLATSFVIPKHVTQTA
jgi:hypothetical protein